MDNPSIPVSDSVYTRTSTINNVKVRVMDIKLYLSVTIYASLFSNNTLIDTKTYLLTGDDYTNWGNNDDYIVNYALTQLGLTKLPAASVQAS